MTDFAAARRMMVDGQIRTVDVTDLRLQSAMLEVERERFVPPAHRAIAYLDRDIPVTDGGRPARRLPKAMVLARMIQAAAIEPSERVLDVGCATGYSAAILARIAAAVIALEEDPELFAAAQAALAGQDKVKLVNGPLAAGWPVAAPYDVILLDGATEIAPRTLLSQLREGGRLVCVLGRAPMGKGTVYRLVGGHVTAQPVFDAAAPLLPGFAKPAEFVF
jgi:protein-L-isoaspartate(D-aspartate) O-methyltransferase